jgi:hypothetical protein
MFYIMAEYELTSEQFEDLRRRVLGGIANEYRYIENGEYEFRRTETFTRDSRTIAFVRPSDNQSAGPSGARIVTTSDPAVERQLSEMGIRPVQPPATYQLTDDQWQELRGRLMKGNYDMRYGTNGDYNIRKPGENRPLASVRTIQNEFTGRQEGRIISTRDPEIQLHLRDMGIQPRTEAPRLPAAQQETAPARPSGRQQ